MNYFYRNQKRFLLALFFSISGVLALFLHQHCFFAGNNLAATTAVSPTVRSKLIASPQNSSSDPYHFYTANNKQDNPYRCSNPGIGLGFNYSPKGFSIYSLSAKSSSPQAATVTLLLEGINKGNAALKPSASPAYLNEGNRLLQKHENFTIEYCNSPEGMRQNFIIDKRPANSPENLQARLTLNEGIVAFENGENSIALLDSAGAFWATYNSLKVWDATGKILPAQMRLENKTIILAVNDQNAQYPVTIDPLISKPAWIGEINQSGAQLGISASSAGDVNGDGFKDLIVGAPYFDENNLANAGRALVYYGGPSGFSAAPNWAMSGSAANAWFGWSVASAGDVNNDGYDDVLIGAPNFTNGQPSEGAAYLYLGSAAGLAANPAWSKEGEQVGALFGVSVASAGDVNQDGFRDIIVGAYLYDNGQTNEGSVFAFYGTPNGISRTANWSAESNQANAQMGISVAAAGDLNQDGFDDIIVGAYGYSGGETGEGAAFLYKGSASGLETNFSWSAESDQIGAQFGIAVAGIGDFNKDGFPDVVVGAPKFNAGGNLRAGKIFLYAGNTTGLTDIAVWSAEGLSAGSELGSSVAAAGDLNNDGFADILAGSWKYTGGQANEGAAFAYYGSNSPSLTASPDWMYESDQAGAQLGSSVAGLGDMNRDGFADIAIGAHLFDNRETDQGRVFTFLGQAPRALINEFSLGNRTEGAAQWVEILVLQDNLDIRNWTLRNGNTTLFTFSPFQTLWQALPAGTLITVYNGGAGVRDTLLPPDDSNINDCNYRLVVSSANSSLFINRNWNNIINLDKDNPTSNPQLYDNAALFNFGTLIHDFDQNNRVDFTDPPLRPAQVAEAVAFKGSNFNRIRDAAQWEPVPASAYNNLATPGRPNGGANDSFIFGLRTPAALLKLDRSSTKFCFNDSVPFIAEFTGGNAPFAFQVTDGAQTWNFSGIQNRTFNFRIGGAGVGLRSYRINEVNGVANNVSCGNIAIEVLNQPLPPALSSTTRICKPGTLVLTANAGIGGDEVRWYATRDTMNRLFTGALFTLPNISATTTFFATTRNRITGCESAFEPAQVIVGNGEKPSVCITSAQDLLPNIDGKITARAAGGVGGNYLFEIQNLGFPNSNGVFEALRPGTYVVTAADSNNCIGNSAPVVISGVKDNRTAFIARGGDGNESFSSVVSTQDGGYIMAGTTQSFGAGKQDAILVKTDANLNVAWARVFGSADNDAFYKTIVTRDGGYLAVGYNEVSPGNTDFLAVKVSPFGALEWRRTYFDANTQDSAFDVVSTPDGGYLLVGVSAAGGNSDMAAVKITATGQTQWARFIGDFGAEEAVSALNLCGGGYLLAGSTTSATGSADLYWAVLANDGVLIDEKTFGDPSADETLSSLEATPDGGYLMGAQTQTGANSDALVVKLNSGGNLTWATRLNGSGQETVAAARVLPRGLGYAVSGSATSYGSGAQDAFLARLDLNGNIVWHKAFGASLPDQAYDMIATSDGGFLMVGSSRSFDVSSDFILIKTDANGTLTAGNCSGSFQTNVARSQTFIDLPNLGFGLNVDDTDSFENNQPSLTTNTVAANELFPSIACGLSTPSSRAEIITTQGATICRGRNASFRVSLTGKAPWSLRYTVNGAQETVINNITTPIFDITVAPNNLGFYEYALREVRDGDNRVGTVGAQTFSLTVTLTSPATATLVTTTEQICAPAQANLLVNLTGTPPWSLSYTINNGSIITDINILTSPHNLTPFIPNVGNNIVRLVGIQDASGCTASGQASGQANVLVQGSTPLQVNLLSQTNADCNGNSANFRVNTSGGPGLPVSYSLDGINFNNTTGIFTEQRSGAYIVTAKSGVCLAVREINLLGAAAPEIVSVNTAPSSTQNTVAVLWNGTPGALSYILAYRPSGTTAWQEVANIMESTFNLTLNYDTQYDFRVRSVCPGGLLSEWSAIRIFRVPADPTNRGCLEGVPSIISISTVETQERNTVRVVWASVSGAINYILQFRNTSVGGAWQEARGFTQTIANIILEPGFSYDFRVQAVCGAGTSPFSTIRSHTLSPVTPSACLTNRPEILGIAALNTTNLASLIRVTWSVIPGARSYIVSYRESTSPTWTEIRGFTSPLAEITLENNTTYEIRVRAVCENGINSGWSIASGYTTPSFNSPCLITRPTITNVSTETLSGSVANVRLNWSTVSNARQYNIRYRLSSGNEDWQEIKGFTVPTALIALAANSSYSFQAQAICDGGLLSDWSAVANHRTPAAAETECATARLLIANIEAINSAPTTETVRLSWATLANAQSYNISYRTGDAEPWVEVRGITASSVDLVLSKENSYEFRLQAVCSGGVASAWSVSRVYTPTSGNGSFCVSSAPNITSVSAPNSQAANLVRISWSTVVGASYYILEYRQTGAVSFIEVPNLNGSFVDLPLNYGVNYEFRIRAFCTVGIPSQYSGIVGFTTAPLPGGGGNVNCPSPGGIVTQGINSNTAIVNWEPLTQNATCYIVAYGLQGTNPANWPQFVVPHPGNTLRMTNLLQGSSYWVRIRTNCSSCALGSGELSTWSGTVAFSTPAQKQNLAENAMSALKVYPNPVQDILQIELPAVEEGKATLTLYALTGEKLLIENLNLQEVGAVTELSLRHLPQGVYLLELKTNQRRFIEKIIKR